MTNIQQHQIFNSILDKHENYDLVILIQIKEN